MFRRFLLILFLIGLVVALIGAAFVTWGYFYLTRDLPNFKSAKDYRPPMVSGVYAADGTLIAEFFSERRYPVTIDEIPLLVRKAFIAAEDAEFYSHKGINPVSIIRAMLHNLRSRESKQGGSTITQQVVKNLLLNPEKTFERKFKEAILAYRLEQSLSKDEILGIYLNQVFFGNTAYGIKAAAQVYFHKELADLDLAEAAMLAGLQKAPSRYSPVSSMERAKKRQRYVLNQMAKNKLVSEQEADEAFREKLQVYRASAQNIYHASYYVSEVRRILLEQFPEYNIDTDGVQIYTALDLKADEFAQAALRRGLREVDKRRGWRGPLTRISPLKHEKFMELYGGALEAQLRTEQVYPAMVTDLSSVSGKVRVDIGQHTGVLDLKQAGWAKKRLEDQDRASWIKPEEVLKAGDVIEIVLAEGQTTGAERRGSEAQVSNSPPLLLQLDQTPDIEGAVVILDPFSGKVVSTIGGYSYQRSQFNRVTQSYRQPGSAFKPIVYLAAVDGFGYTPATIVYDQPRVFRVGDETWSPQNFDEQFLGPITLRVALEKSRNLVSADLVSRIGIDAPIQYAKRLGIKSPLGRNISLALGSSEVTLLELARAYGVFATKGVLFDSVFISKIQDRDGNIVFDYENEKLTWGKKVIDEKSAFLMTNLLKGVVEHGTGYRVKEINRPVAGKTGTSNEQMDTWFLGFTPHWACGVWVGFDVKRDIGDKETGGRVAAPVWLYTMRDYLNYLDEKNYEKLVEEAKAEAERLGIEYVPPEKIQPVDFSVPEGVDPVWINKQSGLLAEPGSSGAIYEYFVKGTEPTKASGDAQSTSSYLEMAD